MAMNELHEAAAFAGGDLDVGDLAKALEEGTQLILSDVARQTTNEDGCVVRVRELIHRLHRTLLKTLLLVVGLHAPVHATLLHGRCLHHAGTAVVTLTILVASSAEHLVQ